jgi:hypothetical protein
VPQAINVQINLQLSHVIYSIDLYYTFIVYNSLDKHISKKIIFVVYSYFDYLT